MIRKIVPSRITDAREARSLSMGDLADSIGVTRQSISKYERGIMNPTPDTLKAISSALCFPIEYFIRRTYLELLVAVHYSFVQNPTLLLKLRRPVNIK